MELRVFLGDKIMSIRKLFVTMVVTGLVFQSVHANNVRRGDMTPELKEKTLQLLSDVAAETRQFVLPSNRIHAQTVILDLMWEHDERGARAISQGVFADLQRMFEAIDGVDMESLTVREKNEHYYRRQMIAGLRRDYILTLVRRDPAASSKALAALKAKKIEGYDPLDASKLELEVVNAMAKKDPERTELLAKEQIATGVTYSMIESLKELHIRDSRVAANVAKEILDVLKAAVIRTPAASGSAVEEKTASGVSAVSGQVKIDYGVAASFVNAVAESARRAARDKDKEMVALLSEAELKGAIEMLADIYLNANDPARYTISQIMAEVSRHAPAHAERIFLKVEPDVAKSLRDFVKRQSDIIAREDKSADELAEFAASAEGEQRDQLYVEAMRKAMEANDPEKARAIGSRMKNPEPYDYLFEEIDAAIPLAKARRGDMTEVRRTLATLKTVPERVEALAALADAIAEKGDKEAAIKLLEESMQMLVTTPVTDKAIVSAGRVVGAYSIAAPDRAFNMFETGIEEMNSYIDAAIKLDEFYAYGSTDSGELHYDAMNRHLLLLVPDATRVLSNLAHADFERSVRLTNKFARPEIQIYGRLRILQVLLDREAAEKEKAAREQIKMEDEYH